MLKILFHSSGYFWSILFVRLMFAMWMVPGVISAAEVELAAVPHGGIQPQLETDRNGTLHLIYYKGNPGHGNLYYTKRLEGTLEFNAPIRVNDTDGSAIAMGTIRGAHMAIGHDGRVHVAWMGSAKVAAETDGKHRQHPMLYTCLETGDSHFRPSRNVVTWTEGIDGGGSIAADSKGNIYIAWHGAAPGNTQGEAGRSVFMAVSRDGGATFSREVRVDVEPYGTCSCCGMRAHVDSHDHVYFLYRTASALSRDMRLLVSTDSGESFSGVHINSWIINTCPMSSASIHNGAEEAIDLVTERSGSVEWTQFRGKPQSTVTVSKIKAKYPDIAINKAGIAMVVWSEGALWDNAGHARWKMYDNNRELIRQGQAEAVDSWSFPSVAVKADGDFILLY